MAQTEEGTGVVESTTKRRDGKGWILAWRDEKARGEKPRCRTRWEPNLAHQVQPAAGVVE